MDKWVLPVNIRKYDIINHLKNQNTFVWKAKKHFKKDDIVYVYITSPIQEIKYKCVCIDENVSETILGENKYALEPNVKRYAKFKVVKEYPKGLLLWSELHNNGMGQALLPTRVYPQLDSFISAKE